MIARRLVDLNILHSTILLVLQDLDYTQNFRSLIIRRAS